MTSFRLRLAGGTAVLLALFGLTPAQDKGKEPPPAPIADRLQESRGQITIAGQKVDYTATTGYLLLKDDEGKPQASIFFVAYNRVRVTEPPPPAPNQPPGAVVVSPPDPARPVTFAFNGGPGSSAVWLHMGAWGPRRAALTDTGDQPPPPARIVDNELSILDFTDLVFIDPVSTGYSRAAPGIEPKKFHGMQEDIASIGEFIRLYLTRFNRWGSPKYIGGESYGTTRAAALTAHLQDTHGIDVTGTVLVSSVLNFGTIRFDEGHDLPYVLYLPAYTATARFHSKLPGDLMPDMNKAIAESEQFANGDYLLALNKGDNLTAEEKQAIARKLSRLTGLSEEFILRNNLRVEIQRFCKELLRDQSRTVGRFDSRIKGTDADAASDRPEADPSYSAVHGAYTGAFNQYVRRDLKFETDLKYEILTGRVQPWDYGANNRFLSVTGKMGSAIRKNSSLRVFVANGYYDLATPFAATDYTLRHLGLDAEQHKRITVQYYEAGHMMYTSRPAHEKLRKDLAAFYGVK